MKTTALLKLLLLPAAMAIAPAASAQDFPTKPVRLVVAFGGGAAGLVHVLAERLKVELGQAVVVDQVPAAGGVIAATTVARAAPDGYTILVGTATALVARPLVMKDRPYDPVGDFTPISQMSTPAFGLALNPKLGITKWEELVEYSKRNPGKLQIGTFGSPALGMVNLVQLQNAAPGFNATSVNYKDDAESIRDTIGGHVDGTIAPSSSLLGPSQQGAVRMILLFSDERRRGYENVPTARELLPRIDTSKAIAGFWGPKNLPRPIVARLNSAFQKALNDPQVREKFVSSGSLPAPGSPEQLGDALATEIRKFDAALKAAGVRPE